MSSRDHATPTVAELVRYGQQVLAAAGTDSARLDCELLLAHALGSDRAAVYRDADKVVARTDRAEFERLIAARAEGRPVAQLLGHAEFWSLRLAINSHVLTPRPETELLVEIALTRLPRDTDCTVAELGTGSGAIAIALAGECPAATIIASDHSRLALSVARRNCMQHAANNVYLVQANWLFAFALDKFDLIVSNPPYVESADARLLHSDIRFEPVQALAAGADGLAAIRPIVAQSASRLRPGGWLLLEHGYNQAERVRALFEAAGFKHIETAPDLAGNARVTFGGLT